MQDIVYKLVPDLQKSKNFYFYFWPLFIQKVFGYWTELFFFLSDEIKREREFYRARGLPYPKDTLPNAGEVEEEKANADAHAESDYHRTDEQVIAASRIQIYHF